MRKLNRLQIVGSVFFVLQILEWCAALSMAKSVSSVSLWCFIIGMVLFVYGTFRKNPTSPAIPDKSVSVSKTLFQNKVAKYETFYTCPACGSLVPKGTYTCDCGFVFRKRHDWRKIGTRTVIILAICASMIGSSYVSFRYGQTSMQSKIQSQYEVGYMEGRKSGYDTGYTVGTDAVASSIFEDGYRTAMSDAGIAPRLDSAHLVKNFKQRDILHSSLSSDYGVGKGVLPRLHRILD